MPEELAAATLLTNKKKPKKVPRIDDLLWKGILEDVFEDFLCFLNPGSRGDFDLKKGFQFLDKELEQVFPPDEDQYLQTRKIMLYLNRN